MREWLRLSFESRTPHRGSLLQLIIKHGPRAARTDAQRGCSAPDSRAEQRQRLQRGERYTRCVYLHSSSDSIWF